jgi:PAS domain-containing protein
MYLHADESIGTLMGSEMTGLSPDEAKGQGWGRALHPEDRERVFQAWHRAAQTREEFSSK